MCCGRAAGGLHLCEVELEPVKILLADEGLGDEQPAFLQLAFEPGAAGVSGSAAAPGSRVLLACTKLQRLQLHLPRSMVGCYHKAVKKM